MFSINENIIVPNIALVMNFLPIFIYAMINNGMFNNIVVVPI